LAYNLREMDDRTNYRQAVRSISTRPDDGRASKSLLLSSGFIAPTSISLIFYIGHYLALVLTPPFLEGQGASASEVGWVSSLFFLGMLAGRPFSARLIERASPVLSLLAGSLLAAISCAALPLMATAAAVACCRTIQGLAVALVTTALTVLVADRTPATRRGEALALFGISANAAAFFAPASGLALANALGYSRAFWVAGAFSAVCVICATSMAHSEKAPEVPAAEEENAPQTGQSDLKGRWAVPSLVIASFGVTFSVHIGFIIVVAGKRGISAQEAGFYYTCYAVAIIFARIISGRALDSRGRNWIIALGNLAAGLAMILLGCTSSLAGLLAAAAIYGLGAGYVYPGVLAYMVELTPANRRGTATASFYAAFEAGIAIAGPLFGWMAMWGGYDLALKVFGAIPVAGALLHLSFTRRPQ
jgi:MFS family permease